MTVVTSEQLEQIDERICNFTEAETEQTITRFTEQQPFLLAYFAVICEQDFGDYPEDADMLSHGLLIIWIALTEVAGVPFEQVQEKDILHRDEKLHSALETLALQSEETVKDAAARIVNAEHPQPHLLTYLLELAMTAEGISDENRGLLFCYWWLILDCTLARRA